MTFHLAGTAWHVDPFAAACFGFAALALPVVVALVLRGGRDAETPPQRAARMGLCGDEHDGHICIAAKGHSEGCHHYWKDDPDDR